MHIVVSSATIVVMIATSKLSATLFSKGRAAVLGVLVLAREEELHLRDIARRAEVDAANALRELGKLEAAGIVVSRRVGRQRFFRMNRACPVYTELTAIVRKTSGLADVLKAALAPLAERIEQAFVYGSMAAGKAMAHSDIDLLIVGSVGGLELSEALSECEQLLAREVNARVYGAQEYNEKIARGRGFPWTAHSGPRIDLIGSRDES